MQHDAKHLVQRPLRPGGPFPGGPDWLPRNTPSGISFVDTAALDFYVAVHDAARTAITRQELSTFEFNFRFKAAAGDQWITQDPWWNNRPPIRLRLQADNTVRPIEDAHPFWGKAGQVAGTWKFEPGMWGARSLPPSQ